MKDIKILLILLLLVLLVLLYILQPLTEGFESASPIPKIIWTYWKQDPIPKSVFLCIDSWKKVHPDFTINLVTEANVKSYLPELNTAVPWNTSMQRESDIIRLHLLSKYGGYWIDASILLTEPINFPITPSTEYVAYYLEKFTSNSKYPVIESWFFGSIPNGRFINAWKDEFMDLNSCSSVDECIEKKKHIGVDFQKIDNLNYLYIHIAAQYVLQKLDFAKEVGSSILLLKAEDGPYKYLTENRWDPKEAVESVCRREHRTPLIKFRGCERHVIESDIDKYSKCIF